MLALWLLALVAVGAQASGDDVLVLTTGNFQQSLKDNEFVLVEFFAPWCGHCKQLAPEYAKAATALKNYKNVKLATVDATVEQTLASDHGVRGYPTLKFFHNGVATDYTGGRTESKIVKWILKAINAPLPVLNSKAEVEEFTSSRKAAVIGFFKDPSAELTAFNKAAADSEVEFAVVHDSKIAGEVNAEFESVVLFKSFDDGKSVAYNGPFTAELIANFANTESVPLVVPFTMEGAGEIFQSKLGKVAFYFGETASPAVNAAAQKYRGKFVFASSDGSIQRLNDHVGVTTLPAFLILTTSGDGMRRFVLNGPITTESLEAHIDAFLEDKLSPTLKSEAAPESNDAPVKVVVGSTFDELVMDPSKNVFLEIYAPWCGHCKSLAPIWDQLASDVAGSNTVIAKMDGTLNEIDGLSWRGFPTLKFYPAGEKARAGVDYNGARELAELKAYVESNAAAASRDEL